MKTIALLALALSLNGCCCWGLGVKVSESYDCFDSQREAYCLEAKTEEEKIDCFGELQERCVHESLTGKFD